MREALIIDLEGYITDVILVEDTLIGVTAVNKITPSILDDEGVELEPEIIEPIGYQVTVTCPDGFYKPRWDFDSLAWVESLTPEEIQAIKDIPNPVTDADKIAKLEAEKTALEERLSATESAIMALMDLSMM